MNTVVKLTQKSVISEIESVLDTYPYQPYQRAFAIPDLRQELVSFVLHRIPCFQNAIPSLQDDTRTVSFPNTHEETTSTLNHKLPSNPLEQQLYLQKLIHQGILSIIQTKSDWISHHFRGTVEPANEPSHWFG